MPHKDSVMQPETGWMRDLALEHLSFLAAHPSIANLSTFHARHKLLLMCYHQEMMRQCGRIASNSAGISLPELLEMYGNQFRKTVFTHPKQSNIINALYHGYGWISEQLSASEKQFFLAVVEAYRHDDSSLDSVRRLLKSYADRLQHDYLGSQALLNPYAKDTCKFSS